MILSGSHQDSGDEEAPDVGRFDDDGAPDVVRFDDDGAPDVVRFDDDGAPKAVYLDDCSGGDTTNKVQQPDKYWTSIKIITFVNLLLANFFTGCFYGLLGPFFPQEVRLFFVTMGRCKI